MRILSLLQPWATLCVIGAKRIETRSWQTKYKGPVLIHASKRLDKQQKQLIHSEPFWSALKHLEELPLGRIIGSVNIEGCSQTPFKIDHRIIMYEFIRSKYKQVDVHWNRVIMAADILIDNVCDPLERHLAFQPGFEFFHVSTEQ